MNLLEQSQIDAFWKNGAVVVADAVDADLLADLRSDFAAWVDESRQQDAAYGAMLDGRPRFDLEPGHSASNPGLRRVASPTEVSDAYFRAAFKSPMAQMVAEVIGPDTRFHHAKVNAKLPQTSTTVKWHQDFTFDPHSNDSVITALLFLDDVTMENGPLLTVPGSHAGPLHSLWHDGKFTGAVDDELSDTLANSALPCTGAAGSVCMMHTRVLHASTANTSDQTRALYIVTYSAADAVPLAANAVPSRHAGLIVCGSEPGKIRTVEFEMDMPEVPTGASFFVQQAGGD